MAWMGGTLGGAAAAAKKKRDEAEEEQELTRYSEEDLRQEWEFKIVRSLWPVFNNRDKLEQVIAEEAQAGWQFVELFDAQRVRFKRPGTAHKYDDQLPPGINPYRTDVGGMQMVLLALVIAGVLVVILAGIVVTLTAG